MTSGVREHTGGAMLGVTLRALTLMVALTAWACGGSDATPPPPSPGQDGETIPDIPKLDDISGHADTTPAEDHAPKKIDSNAPDILDATTPVEPVPCSEEGTLCDDQNPCTYPDRCSQGLCSGPGYSCDDGRVCTNNQCDGYGGCRFPISDTSCLIHNICYDQGKSGLFSPCLICEPSESQTSFVVAADGNACGGDDFCLGEGTCTSGQCSATASNCNDSNPCTDDLCDPVFGCVHTHNFDLCDDGHPCSHGDQCEDGSCVTGAVVLNCDDNNVCTIDSCSQNGCVHIELAIPCDDNDQCTENDLCSGGLCQAGNTLSCNDGNNCTDDSCSTLVGCTHSLINNPCCVGAAHICNDDNACTEDICDETTGTCSWANLDGACDDNNACTFADNCSAEIQCVGEVLSCDDGNSCTTDSCSPSIGCHYAPVQGPCSDLDNCTVDDNCIGTGHCIGTLLSCNDYNACTIDQCTASGGCDYAPADSAACNDGDLCTNDDSCQNSVCAGTPKDCSDGNPCTADVCHPSSGCQHVNVVGSCDDDNPCTTSSECDAGVCVGAGTDCGACITFTAPVNKINEFALGVNGQPGEALNVDGKSTCSPITDCSGGLDNSLSPLSAIANDPLNQALSKAEIILLFEHRDFTTDGSPYSLVLWDARITSEDVASGCDFQNEPCEYLVAKSSISSDCTPQFNFDNATITGNQLHAGGENYGIFVFIPLSADTMLPLVVINAEIRATVTMVDGKPQIVKGVLGGAISKASLVQAVNAVPDEDIPPEISKTAILALLNLVVKNDIDSNGDGNKDASSVGLPFNAIPATIVGVKN